MAELPTLPFQNKVVNGFILSRVAKGNKDEVKSFKITWEPVFNEEQNRIPPELKPIIEIIFLPLSKEWELLGVKQKLYIGKARQLYWYGK